MNLNETNVCLDLSSTISYKKKKKLIEFIVSNGGKIKYFLNKNVQFLVKDDKSNVDTYKCRRAIALGVRLLHVEFVELAKDRQEIHLNEFFVKNKESFEGFKHEKLEKRVMSRKNKSIDLNKLVKYTEKTIDKSFFDDSNFYIGKWIVFHKFTDSSLAVFELHKSDYNEKFKYNYRLRIQISNNSKFVNECDDKSTNVEYVFAEDGETLFQIYKHYASEYMNESCFRYDTSLPNRSIGSKRLQQVAWKSFVFNANEFDKDVLDFVDFIWHEAIGDFNDLFWQDNFTVEQIDKAEAILRKQSEEIKNGGTLDFSSDFYSVLSVNSEHWKSITDKYTLFQRFELCQTLRDMVNISEATNWNTRSSKESKYRSIGAYIKKLNKDEEEFLRLKSQILNSSENGKEEIKIANIYEIIRPTENLKFSDYLHNKKLLFHGSKIKNFVGILSRGLLLPNYVVENIGVNRSDVGLLGAGIYFSDSINTSLKYCDFGKLRNNRLIVVCDVALGDCKECHKFDTSLTHPPKDFHSTHGVKCRNGVQSQFDCDEYVIYDATQQRIRYLIEIGDEYSINSDCENITPVEDEVSTTTSNIQFSDFYNFVPLENHSLKMITYLGYENSLPYIGTVSCINEIPFKVPQRSYGLLNCSNGSQIPLISVNIRTQIVDVLSKVAIYQEYFNETDSYIEVKYIFPLDEKAAICGFEAHINEKRLIGVCEEKNKAHSIYNAAVGSGCTAYLMDQDEESDDVFCVRIGNLPPRTRCIVKITYVAELSIENEQIVFRLPVHVAPWKSKQLEGEQLQDVVMTKYIGKLLTRDVSLEISVIMPFDINSIHSPSHRINVKKTQSQGVVQLSSGQALDETFILFIHMPMIHIPRMMIEDTECLPNERACMLAFYPKFESEIDDSPCIIFLIDCSNSMDFYGLPDAKRLCIEMLKTLPKKCTFNVVLFGSDVTELFPFCVEPTEENLNKATKFIYNAKSNKGNTDLLNALHSYFLFSENDVENYVLISDGHISEQSSILSTIKNSKRNAANKRIFTCAVGKLANNSSLQIISDASGATCEIYDAKCDFKWKDKILDLMDKIRQPSAISNIKIEWNTHTSDYDHDSNASNAVRLQAPSIINTLFNGRRLVVYGFVPNCQQATLHAEVNGQELSTIVSCSDLSVTKCTILHELTAKALIDDLEYLSLENSSLEDRTEIRNKMIQFSKNYGIICKYASFVAVGDKKIEENTIFETPKIDSFLSTDKDSACIDILPYMDYSCQESSYNYDNQIEDYYTIIDESITQIESVYRTPTGIEQNKLNLIVENLKDKIDRYFSIGHPLYLKYARLVINGLLNNGQDSKALEFGKKCVDNANCVLDRVSSEYYDEYNSLFVELKNKIKYLKALR